MTVRRSTRRSSKRPTSRLLHLQALERRELLAAEIGLSNAPRLIAVAANSGENFDLLDNNELTVSPRELKFRFDGGQELDPETFSAFRFIGAGGDGSFDDGNERVVTPGFIGFEDRQGTRIVVARFAEALPDDQYLIEIAGYDDTNAGIVGLRNIDGDLFRPNLVDDPERPTARIRFEVEVGPQVVAVVPQPIVGTGASRAQLRNQIHVFFNEDPLSNPAAGVVSTTGSANDPSVVRPEFYNLFLTQDTVETGDDLRFNPVSIEYDPALHRAVLTFEGSDLSDLPGMPADGSGTFRLRIGSSEPLPTTLPPVDADLSQDVGGTFADAFDLGIEFGADRDASIVISGEIEAIEGNTMRWPGIDAPGVRDDRRASQVAGRPDTQDGVNVFYYNFASVYGTDPAGNILRNAITPAQQQRTREILDLYSRHLGVQFIEAENRGLQIVTGDLRALVETASTGPGAPFQEFRVNDEDPTQGVLILDAGENWYDGYGLSPDARPSWFVEALRGVGSLLGIGDTFEQVPGVASGSNPDLASPLLFPNPDGSIPADFSIEPHFLRTSDIVPGQAMHRPEIRDADLYRFTVREPGQIAIESFAERLLETSLLDTDLKLWKFDPVSGRYELVARNSDFFGNDSFIGVDVEPLESGEPAIYVVGITAKGNEYNPDIAGSGGGGRTQGEYELRITFRSDRARTIVDTTGSRLDGNADGEQGGDFNFWFRVARPRNVAGPNDPRTLFVNPTDGANTPSRGSLAQPFRNINYAFSQARPGDIVRLLPDGGADGLIETTEDNRAYEIGRLGGNPLADGDKFEIPRGVTVMIDAGAILKFLNAKITVGSETIDDDRSLAALQVLGAPIIVDQNGDVIDGAVRMTSHNEERRDGRLLGIDTNPLPTTPGPGDWAGIEFRNDVDFSEGRPVWESEGIFLDYVSHADIRFGGGSVTTATPSVAPIEMRESRPTLIFNEIRNSREAAMNADPNSFLETNFHAPLYQQASLERFGERFTSDYARVGPHIRGNTLVENSINGLFVRVVTPAVGEREPMTVSGRFDDRDIVHVLSEVLVLQGQPGGPLLLEQRPDVLSVTVNNASGSGSLPEGVTLDYRVTFVTRDGFESLASEPTRDVTVGAAGVVLLNNLPVATDDFAGRRLYRRTASGDYVFVTQLDRATPQYRDDGTTRGGLLSAGALAADSGERLLPRTNARLSIDPGIVVKLDSARIEATFGADFYAEGTDENPIVFTSRLDDRFGAGGTFDTNNDGSQGVPAAGDWGGLVFRQGSSGSIDHAVITFGGGESAVSGDFASFNAVEILQADVRIANSRIADNADGFSGSRSTRDGIGFNGPASIFVRGAQPIIVANTIVDNAGAAISINPDALNHLEVLDAGRGTGPVDRYVTDTDNQGPLVSGNRLNRNDINGMLIRNESLTSESVWDDTDIVHVVEGRVYAWNHHHRSGLRLKSDPNQSLVVKFQDGGALVASRVRTDVVDSIGGTIQVLGQPGFPVTLTSIHDDTVGAGFTPEGLPQTNTDNASVTPMPGDWQGIVINPGANDRNVGLILEAERAVPAAAATNAVPDRAQRIGSLARNETSADENRRLGFNIRGTLSRNSDIDVYSFTANGGTEVFLDIDDTGFGLDTVVELIDINGNILALSNSSFREAGDPSLLVNNIGPGRVLPLFKTGHKVVENPNPLDAGMRVILPGNSATVNRYYVRVRSSNLRPGDNPARLTNPDLVGAGQSSGQYQLSIRLRETDEIAGSTVRLADIRYATTAIDVPAAPNNSPLAAEFAERIGANGLDVNASNASFDGAEGSASFDNATAGNLGALNASDRGVLRVSGVLGNNVATTNPQFGILSEMDLDVFRIDLFANEQAPRVIGQNRFVSTTFDIDYADQLGRPNTYLSVYTADGRLILHARDSNVADDQARPLQDNDMSNLGAGSAGTLDPFIGPVELQEGTYYVVVSSAQMVPQSLNQLFRENPADTNVRVLPINSVRRIAEEGFNETVIGVNTMGFPLTNQQLNTTADLPTVRPFFDDTSIVPYKLEDVRMFLTLNQGLTGGNNTTLISVDPFTGQLERTIGQFGQPVGDLAIRRDGELFGYSLGPASGGRTNANTGNFLNISSATGGATNIGDDGLVFRRDNAERTGTENDDNAQYLVNALAFVPQQGNQGATPGNNPGIPGEERAITVGNRDNVGRGELPDELRRNVVFSMVANTGAATNQGSTNTNLDRNFGDTAWREFFGPGSNKQELGVVDTGQFPDSPAAVTGELVDGGDITGIAMDPTSGALLIYAVSDGGYVYSFNPNQRRIVDVESAIPGSFARVINSTNHGRVTPHPDDSLSQSRGFVDFTGMTLGPRLTERLPGSQLGPFARVLFGTTSNGWIYTMAIDPETNRVEPAPVLFNGRSAVQLVDPSGFPLNVSPTGVAFSIREENPWHVTSDRATPSGIDGPNSGNNLHGVFRPEDQSRPRISGGNSLYFGFEIDGNVANNTLDGGNGTLNPGGVHGSTVSRPFSLEGYAPGDKPTLYFNYFLEVEEDDDYVPGSRQQVDSFRVFAAGDDGQWRLLATNNSFRSRGISDEFDYFGDNGGMPVQELFDNTNVWRQARVDLSPLAGNRNVQLRFDFSTAGGMQSQFVASGFLTELQAAAGTDIVEGTTFSLASSTDFSFRSFEFVRGGAFNVPSPATILNGQQITVADLDGVGITITLTTEPAVGFDQVEFSRDDTAEELAQAIVDALQGLAPQLEAFADERQVRIPDASSFSLTPARFGGAEVVVPDPADVDLVGGSVQVVNNDGRPTTVNFRTGQEVSFSRGGQQVRVTANVPGAADGVAIRFDDRAGGFFVSDTPQAFYNPALRVIRIEYNSLATADDNNFDAVVEAINGLPGFSAELTAGDGGAFFQPPFGTVVFPRNEIFLDAGDTAESVASAIAAKLSELDGTVSVVADGERLRMVGAASVTPGPLTLVSLNNGGTAAQFLPEGNVPIFYNSEMSSTEVRESIRRSLVEGLGTINPVSGVSSANLGNFPAYGTNRIRLFNHSLAGNSSSTGFSTFLPGDEFGAFSSRSVSNAQVNQRPGLNNAIEGVYIDDIVVGFAERGEMVLNAPVNRNFDVLPENRTFSFIDSQQPEFPNEILVGGYTLEVRTSASVGVPEDYDPIRLGLNEQLGLGRSFDTNDRLADGVTLIAPSSDDLVDGDLFVIGNGTRQVTFEFDNDGVVAPGHVRVPFEVPGTGTDFNQLSDDARVVAASIRDAINSPQARNILGITAAGRDSRTLGPMTTNRVALFGQGIQVNPTVGRFIKLDLVREETFYGRDSARMLPDVDHTTETVQNAIFLDTFARASVTDYVNGATDTLVAVGKIGDNVPTDDANVLIPDAPMLDADIVKIFLNEGDTIDVDLDAVGWALGTQLTTPRLEIFDNDINLLDSSDLHDASAPGKTQPGAFIGGFEAPASGFYYVRVSSTAFPSFFADEGFGEYQLTIRPSTVVSNGATIDRHVLMVDYHLDRGDTNRVRDQGQYIIESNFVSDFASAGIRANFGNNLPNLGPGTRIDGTRLDDRPGGVALLRNDNTQRLLPGSVISNNVIIAGAGGTGIEFSGEAVPAGQAPAPVPFGRIVNNTVVGNGSGVGIDVFDAASPTVLNNVVSGFGTGLRIAGNSNSTVSGGNAFHANATNANRPLANSSIVIPDDTPLFQEPERRIFIPATGSAVIDSSFASLNDRSVFVDTVKQPVGIASSPIIAPSFDAYGIPRFDDPQVTTPGGVGSNVFIDRGAIDRADFIRPEASLVSPLDFVGSPGTTALAGDVDPSFSFVRLLEGSVSFFEIQLTDPAGTGPDRDTLTADSVLLTENGRILRPDIDYTFGYNDNSRTIRLTPLAGLWRPDAVYEITLNNQARIAYAAPDGGQINDGDQVRIADTAGTQVVFEFDSGYAVEVPQTTLITVNETNAGFNDRDTFTIQSPVIDPDNGARNSLTFEINRVGGTAPGNIPVELGTAGTIREVRDAILAAFQRPFGDGTVSDYLDVVPTAVGLDRIQLGTVEGHIVNFAGVAGLTVSGVISGIENGQTFTYTGGTGTVRFQFTLDGNTSGGNVAIPFSRTETPEQIAETIAAVVGGAGVGLDTAQSLGGGAVLFGGQVGDLLDLDATALQLTGTPGVDGSLALTVPQTTLGSDLAGRTFSIDVDGLNVTFEYTLVSGETSVNELILLGGEDAAEVIAQKTAARIADAFPDELSPTADGRTVSLGELPAIPPADESPSLTMLDAADSGLVASGVSGGAVRVGFLPTPQFTAASAVAQLQTAIEASPLAIETFTPGGGTLLISGAASLNGRVAGEAVSDLGRDIPAIADLAGNPVRETRENNETRFTVIMPQVRFDFGDAPDSYGTTLARDGARHTVSGDALPRLGRFIDTEEDGQPFPDSDDEPIEIGGEEIGNVFAVDMSREHRVRVTVTDTTPVGGETFTLSLGGRQTTFELIDAASNPAQGNVPVIFNPGDSPEAIASRLATAIRPRLAEAGGGVLMEVDPTDPATLLIDAIDDEDGVSIGRFTNGGQTFNVFTVPGTDPANVTADQIIGFLNPQNPQGATVAITVTGSGLIDAWIDFDGDGTFDEREQVLKNAPVVNGVNLLNIAVPADAVEGDTWARFRISETGNLNPTGVAVGGEVEDYQVSIVSVTAPVAQPDFYQTREDTLLIVGEQNNPLTSNDDNLDEQFFPPSVLVVSGPEHGTLTIEDPFLGTFRYQPDPHFNGIDTFVYELNGSPATVTIEVIAVNDPPQFEGDLDVSSLEDAGVVTIPNWATGVQAGPDGAVDELANETVPPQLPLEFVITPIDASAAAAVFAQMPTAVVDGSTASLTYETKPNQNGQVEFSVVLRDQGGTAFGGIDTSTPRTFTIDVIAVNDPPEFTPGGRVTVLEDSGPYSALWATEIRPGPITATDELDQTVSFQVETPAEFQDKFATLPAIDDDGVLTFVPADNANGLALIEVIAIDSEGAAAEPVTLEIFIEPVNDPPIAIDDFFQTDEDTVLVLQSEQLLENDIDVDLETDPDEFLSVTMPLSQVTGLGALVTFNPATGEIVYDPTDAQQLQQLRPGQTLDDTFQYRAVDAAGALSNFATVTIRVDGVNDPPVANNVTRPLNLTGPTTIDVLANDTDIDGTIDPTSLQITLQPAFGFLSVASNGVVTYTPFGAQARDDEFRYTVADDLGARSNEARVILSTNQAPVATNDFATTFRNQPVTINVIANDFDPDGSINPGSVAIVNPPTRGAVSLVGPGQVRYTPEAGFVGTDTFRYTVEDLTGLVSNPALVTVNVLASPGQNPVLPSDVNADGFVSAIDALLIINKLSRDLPPGQTSIPVDPSEATPPFFDVNGDQVISSLDALLVINALARQQSGGSGEGERVEPEAIAPLAVQVDTAASFWRDDAVPPLDVPVSRQAVREALVERYDPADRFDAVDAVVVAREQAARDDDDLAALDEVLALLD